MTRWKSELEKVRIAHRGRLHPKHVVAAARDPSSALHDRFEWDDSKAGELYRLEQASVMIREVTFLPKGADEPIRAYVSLSSDRISGSGYRAMVDVLSDKQLRAQLIEDAKNELSTFSNRYEKLRKLGDFSKVFKAIDKVTAQSAAN